MNNWIYLALFALCLVQVDAGVAGSCVVTSTAIPWAQFTDDFCESDYMSGAVTARPWEMLLSGVNLNIISRRLILKRKGRLSSGCLYICVLC